MGLEQKPKGLSYRDLIVVHAARMTTTGGCYKYLIVWRDRLSLFTLVVSHRPHGRMGRGRTTP